MVLAFNRIHEVWRLQLRFGQPDKPVLIEIRIRAAKSSPEIWSKRLEFRVTGHDAAGTLVADVTIRTDKCRSFGISGYVLADFGALR